MASGRVAPLNRRPISAPTTAPPKVLMKPCNEAPMPATEPTGSIAMAPKFDAVRPMQARVADCSSTKVHRRSRPSVAISTCAPVIEMNTSNPRCEMTRIPTRSTILEFRNAVTPIDDAHSANMVGIRPGR